MPHGQNGGLYEKRLHLRPYIQVAVRHLAATVGVLFTIYFLNLDMKLVGWLYTVLNKFHDRKVRDVQF